MREIIKELLEYIANNKQTHFFSDIEHDVEFLDLENDDLRALLEKAERRLKDYQILITYKLDGKPEQIYVGEFNDCQTVLNNIKNRGSHDDKNFLSIAIKKMIFDE